MLNSLLIILLQLPVVPGSRNLSVTESNIQDTICFAGWTKTVRPPTSYTNKLKKQLMKNYGLPGKISDYELDHDIPLELGGHPTSPENLWMQAYKPEPGARQKDIVEKYLNRQVCSGKIGLIEAQEKIRINWLDVYKAIQVETALKKETK